MSARRLQLRNGTNVRWLARMGLLSRIQQRLEERSRVYHELLDCSVWTHWGDMMAHTLLEAIRAEQQREYDEARNIFLRRSPLCVRLERAVEVCRACLDLNCNACDGGECRCPCALELDLMRRIAPSTGVHA